MTPSDEECIAIAMLHGAEFTYRPEAFMSIPPPTPWSCWHPQEADEFDFTWEQCDGLTQGCAARRYCIRHHLI